jgi:2-C-methyl-D-erythritol 4-phosphate cytidylyltransferase / 2-C-methyl-D-erythritol 2,4-cyclodiphosphate synthase
MHVAAIIVAAGKGERAGLGQPKQFLDLGDGQPMLAHSLEAFAACDLVREIVLVLPAGWQGTAWPTGGGTIRTVTGGARRQDSVGNALATLSDAVDLIVIHDAARPFVTADLIERTIRAAAEHGAAIAALAATDTVKQASDQDADGTWRIRATLPRETIYLAQTPQAFRRSVLTEAMTTMGGATFTDEAMLVERAGFPVHIVAGDPANIKVTTPHDLAAARSRVAGGAAAMTMRIGSGYDLHRLVEGRPLILAGVRVPFERGLSGHSDADLVCHAVTDAILGAAGLGDIGRFFPDSEPRWKDADSLQLLGSALEAVHRSALRVVNVDVTVIAERPKLLPYLDEMRANLARVLQVEISAVSVKGKTNETVDATGRGEAMACHAVALLTR